MDKAKSLLHPTGESGRVGPGGVPDPLADSLSEPVLHAGWSELGPVPVEDTLGTICYQSGYLARRKAPKFKGGGLEADLL
jgi:hypothetical protein